MENTFLGTQFNILQVQIAEPKIKQFCVNLKSLPTAIELKVDV